MRDIWFCPAISDSSAVSVVWSQSSDLRGILDSVQSVACENWQSFCRVSSPKTTLNGWCSSRVSMYCVSHVEQLKVWPERSSCHWRKSPKWTRPWYKSRPPWLVIAWTYGTPGENSGSHQQIASTWSHDISTFLVFSFTERRNWSKGESGYLLRWFSAQKALIIDRSCFRGVGDTRICKLVLFKSFKWALHSESIN